MGADKFGFLRLSISRRQIFSLGLLWFFIHAPEKCFSLFGRRLDFCFFYKILKLTAKGVYDNFRR
jgi:hypothetical protein